MLPRGSSKTIGKFMERINSRVTRGLVVVKDYGQGFDCIAHVPFFKLGDGVHEVPYHPQRGSLAYV